MYVHWNKWAHHEFQVTYKTEEFFTKGKAVAENFSINLPSCATASEMTISFVKQLYKMKNSFGYLVGATAGGSTWMVATVHILKGIVGKRSTLRRDPTPIIQKSSSVNSSSSCIIHILVHFFQLPRES